MRRILIIAALSLVACSRGPGAGSGAPASSAAAAVSSTQSASSAAPSAKLARIFTADMIGANVAYLETITGPAFRNDGDEATYKVDGCEVIVGETKGKIDNLGVIGLSPHCSFDIAQYFAGGYAHPVPSLPTFSDIKVGLGGDYAADCYMLCGNAAAPLVSLAYQGNHADNFNQLVASVDIGDGPPGDAYADWGAKLAAKYGQDAVVRQAFADNLADVAARDFGPIHPTTIRVGQKLIPVPG